MLNTFFHRYFQAFPGDFLTDELDLKTDIQLNFESQFDERLSTGYYLPAGLRIIVNILSGNTNNWSIRIGEFNILVIIKLYLVNTISIFTRFTY